ncbi:YciI family protein [Amycolatopsis sp. YIM 10]|uniref:YciI family protein n=1 Tax=Amycolatopsis sp. YIM 10 TaxID=2653857 RepID=UPI0012900FF1|nr:YciI family protein [Amycolatopsis sp. YIM 10]QFU89377.1 YCII-related domain protein [Amycolatopsis sp. YIM 10]
MRYLVVLEASQPDTPPPAELMAGIMQLGAEATQSGAMIDNAGLAPSADGAKVTLDGDAVTITDGPFAESKEMISYAIYDTRTKEEAVEWTRRFLALHAEHWPGWTGEARVLRVFGPADMPGA